MYGCLSNTAAWVPATDCILFFCSASAGEPPVMGKPTRNSVCGEEDFLLWVTSCFLCPLSLSVSASLLIFFLLFFVIHWCTHIRTHKEKVHSMLSDCIAYLCHNQHIQAKPPQPLTFRKEMFLLIEIANDSHYFPTATSTACIYSFSLALGTDTKCDFQ